MCFFFVICVKTFFVIYCEVMGMSEGETWQDHIEKQTSRMSHLNMSVADFTLQITSQ